MHLQAGASESLIPAPDHPPTCQPLPLKLAAVELESLGLHSQSTSLQAQPLVCILSVSSFTCISLV